MASFGVGYNVVHAPLISTPSSALFVFATIFGGVISDVGREHWDKRLYSKKAGDGTVAWGGEYDLRFVRYCFEVLAMIYHLVGSYSDSTAEE